MKNTNDDCGCFPEPCAHDTEARAKALCMGAISSTATEHGRLWTKQPRHALEAHAHALQQKATLARADGQPERAAGYEHARRAILAKLAPR